jgi:transglutaminase-like putative cysteine protease
MRYYRLLLCGLLLTALCGANSLRANSELKQRKFEFTYTATVQVPEGARSAALWIPLPGSDSYQEITNVQIKTDYPVSFNTDPEYGNSVLYVSVASPKPGPLQVEMTCQVLRREHVNRPGAAAKASDSESADPLMPRWLQPDRLVPINDRIRNLAAEVTKGKNTDLEKLRAIYDYAVSNMKYDKTGTGWGRGDIYFACDEKRGNCTDFHALVIGLCRASGIPARFEMGFSVPDDKPEGQIGGYHCWAQVFIKGAGWVPIDASEAGKNPQKKEYFFGAHDADRVKFTIGRDIPLRPRTQAGPMNFFIYPYAEIDGKTSDKVERKFAYRNL